LSDDAADRAVRAQYEALPYPPRDPADEAKRLVVGSPSHLLEIEHYVFGGRRAGPLRALVAGGGTGDGAIMLAQQLAWRGEGTVDYLDLSAASRQVAEARARARGLANIRFHTGSLLELRRLGLDRPYDYIDCCGVLHHLDDPAAGLAALVGVLAPGGGLGLMLYGALGRSGVYPLQRALRRLAGADDTTARLRLARRLLDGLPPENLFRRNPRLGDHRAAGEAGLFDLLLHARDRAYTVDDAAGLVAAAGLRIAAFLPPLAYMPELLLADPELKGRAARLDPLEKAALAEELGNSQKTHVFYAVARDNPVAAAVEDMDLVPCWRPDETARLIDGLARGERLKADLEGVPVRLAVPREALALLRDLDGRRSLGALYRLALAREPGLAVAAFRRRVEALLLPLRAANLLLFGGPAAPPR